MKATMSKTGIIIITPETEVESYSLKQWVIDNIELHRSRATLMGLKVTKGLIIQTGMPKD